MSEQQQHLQAPAPAAAPGDNVHANAVPEGQGANANAVPSQGVANVPCGQGATAAIPSATFTIKPPEPFDFSKPHEWEKWICHFERFRLASNLNNSSDANQVNTLVYCMGGRRAKGTKAKPAAASAVRCSEEGI